MSEPQFIELRNMPVGGHGWVVAYLDGGRMRLWGASEIPRYDHVWVYLDRQYLDMVLDNMRLSANVVAIRVWR